MDKKLSNFFQKVFLGKNDEESEASSGNKSKKDNKNT